MFDKILAFFKSIKLAIVLLLYIALTSVIATFIPQAQHDSYYYEAFPGFLAWFITETGFSDFFRSFLFLFPVLLFFLNISICAIDRFTKSLKRKKNARYGPDIIHAGLILLIISGFITYASSSTMYHNLVEGDTVSIGEGYTLTLTEFQTLRYESGAPRDWISSVIVGKDGRLLIENFDIEVNNPLVIGPYAVYQSSYGNDYVFAFSDSTGSTATYFKRDMLQTQEGLYFIDDVVQEWEDENPTGVTLAKWENHAFTEQREIGIKEKIGEYTLESIAVKDITVLSSVTDAGFLPVMIAFIIITTGLALFIFQKIGDRQL